MPSGAFTGDLSVANNFYSIGEGDAKQTNSSENDKNDKRKLTPTDLETANFLKVPRVRQEDINSPDTDTKACSPRNVIYRFYQVGSRKRHSKGVMSVRNNEHDSVGQPKSIKKTQSDIIQKLRKENRKLSECNMNLKEQCTKINERLYILERSSLEYRKRPSSAPSICEDSAEKRSDVDIQSNMHETCKSHDASIVKPRGSHIRSETEKAKKQINPCDFGKGIPIEKIAAKLRLMREEIPKTNRKYTVIRQPLKSHSANIWVEKPFLEDPQEQDDSPKSLEWCKNVISMVMRNIATGRETLKLAFEAILLHYQRSWAPVKCEMEFFDSLDDVMYDLQKLITLSSRINFGEKGQRVLQTRAMKLEWSVNKLNKDLKSMNNYQQETSMKKDETEGYISEILELSKELRKEKDMLEDLAQYIDMHVNNSVKNFEEARMKVMKYNWRKKASEIEKLRELIENHQQQIHHCSYGKSRSKDFIKPLESLFQETEKPIIHLLKEVENNSFKKMALNLFRDCLSDLQPKIPKGRQENELELTRGSCNGSETCSSDEIREQEQNIDHPKLFCSSVFKPHKSWIPVDLSSFLAANSGILLNENSVKSDAEYDPAHEKHSYDETKQPLDKHYQSIVCQCEILQKEPHY